MTTDKFSFARAAWLAGLIATAATAPAPFAAHAGTGPDTPSVKVFHGDLDLTTEAGVASLESRVDRAVRAVCRRSSVAWEPRSLGKCRRVSAENANRKVQAAVYAARQRQDVQLAAR
jgi:UrcA family protein